MSFLAQTLVFLVAAILVVPLCKRLGLSSVLGYLGAGLLIGPNGLGLIGDSKGVLQFAEIGVVLLLFIIGLELQPRRLWVMRKSVFGLGSTQVLITTIVIAGSLKLVFHLPWPAAGLLGFALALSSTAFVLQLLGEQRKLYHPHGRAAFGVLLLQDMAVIPAIAVLSVWGPNSAQPVEPFNPWMLLAVIVGLVGARFGLQPMLRLIASTGIHELFAAASLAIVVGAALAMEHVGLSMGLGAFIAGMMVADSEYRHQLESDVTPFKGLLLGLFFIAVGMSADVRALGEAPITILGLTLALVGVKAVILLPLARLHGLDTPEALRTAVVLSQGGEFAFVLLLAGSQSGVITSATAELAILIVTLSMASTPLLVAMLEKVLSMEGPPEPYDTIDEPDNPVIIAGFGRVGQIVARILTMRHVPFTALEIDPKQVEFVRQFGNEIYFGDACRLELLNAAHVREARAFILTLNDLETSLRIASLVRETFPNVTIMARARNRYHELRLRELGVHFVIRDTLMSSLELSRNLLHELGLSEAQASTAIETFHQHDTRTLEKQAAVFHDEAAFHQSMRDSSEELKELFGEDAAAKDADVNAQHPDA